MFCSLISRESSKWLVGFSLIVFIVSYKLQHMKLQQCKLEVVFPFYTTLYFYSATIHREMLYFLLYYIYLTAIIPLCFADKDFYIQNI